MAKQPASIQILDVEGLAEDKGQPLSARVENRIRRAILSGNLPTGSRLPSSRVLAQDLGVSRQTVEAAFDQLEAQGFVVRRRGSGTFVARELPDRAWVPQAADRGRPLVAPAAVLSLRGRIIAEYPGHHEPTVGRAFTPSIPAVDLFPRQIWTRLMVRAARRPGVSNWVYGASNGLAPLREAIAAHVAGSRAVTCSPDQVIVVSSAQQGVDLVARVLLDPDDPVWVEDPGYPPVAHLFRAAGARVVPIPVDENGLDTTRALAIEPHARLAYVTPSHQYPSGGLMPLTARQLLLEWAERKKTWILEDDYDGDFRYAGRPLASLQGLDRASRVIYAGTFNKMMFPSLRIAFLIVPPSLVDPFLAAKHMMDGHAPGLAQAALADFIHDGHLATHLRRLLSEYDRRRMALLAELESLGDQLTVGPAEAGLHVAVYLKSPGDDRQIARGAARKGVDLHPLSRFYQGQPRQGFVLGFACTRPSRTAVAMRLVAKAIQGEAK